MTEQTDIVVETPEKTKRFRLKLPSLTTVRNTAILGAVAGAGAFAHAKLSKKSTCPLEAETTVDAGTTDN